VEENETTQENQETKKRGPKPKPDPNADLVAHLLKRNQELEEAAKRASAPQSQSVPIFSTLSERRQIEQSEYLLKLGIDDMEGTTEMISGSVDKNYTLKEREKHLYHLRLVMHPSQRSGEGKTVMRDGKLYEEQELASKVQKISQKKFKKMKGSNALNQYKQVIILHDPTRK